MNWVERMTVYGIPELSISFSREEKGVESLLLTLDATTTSICDWWIGVPYIASARWPIAAF